MTNIVCVCSIYIKYVNSPRLFLIFIMTTFIDHYYDCSLNEWWLNLHVYNRSQVQVHFFFVMYFSFSHITSSFLLDILLHHRKQKKKKNLISRSIISSVSDNDKKAFKFSLLLNWNRCAHSCIYINFSTVLHRIEKHHDEKKRTKWECEVRDWWTSTCLCVCVFDYLK